MEIKNIEFFDVNGKAFETESNTKEKEVGDVKIYEFGAKTQKTLNSERGAEIYFNEEFSRFTAITMFSPYWCRPFFGTCGRQIPERTQALILEKKGGYKFVLSVCHGENKTFFEGADCFDGEKSNGFKAVVFSLNEKQNVENQPILVCAEGNELKEIIKKCFKVALSLNFGENGAFLRENRDYPEVFDYLGWCTWDALQIRVSFSGIKQKIEEFESKNIPVKYVIIDDMWADCTLLNEIPIETEFANMVVIQHESKMRDFCADKTRFKGGLKEVCDFLHEKNIKVGVWYPMTGYWRGILKGGALYEKVKDCLITVSGGREVVSPEYDKAKKFFDYLNGVLKADGVDFIKVDNQSCYELYYKDVMPVGTAAKGIQRAIEDSAFEFFGGNLINCMGMDQECMLNRKKSAVCRSSDDFMPENAEWFSKHIFQCSYNSLVYGEVYVCDWDMWWTDDAQSGKNGLLRALSGGPVYVSDKINRSNVEVLKPICFCDGKILKADKNLVPVTECLFEDMRISNKPFCVFNECGGSVCLAAFNVTHENAEVCGEISLEQFGFKGEVAVYNWFNKTCEKARANDKIKISLKNNYDYSLYIITPISGGVAVIGATEKYLSPAAIKRENDGLKVIDNCEIAVFCDDVSVEKSEKNQVVLNDKKIKLKKGLNFLG